MGAPQITLIILWALALGITAEQHGKPKKGNESFWRSLLSVAIISAILWWGGFWN
jgi:hypothetical protein